jgi:hypothetical protein
LPFGIHAKPKGRGFFVRFFAYLDANSGSMIAAAVAGGLAGIAVVFKVWWRRFTGLFSPRRRAEARQLREAAAAEAMHAEAVHTEAMQPEAAHATEATNAPTEARSDQ